MFTFDQYHEVVIDVVWVLIKIILFLYINRKQCCDGVFCMSNDGVYGYVKE